VLAALLDHHDTVLLPYGGNCRYDFAIDVGEGTLVRIECKTGWLRRGVIHFKTYSPMEHRRPGARSTYHGQADYSGVYCPETGAVYLVPVGAVGVRDGSLRVEPTKNNQASSIRWARDFELTSAGQARLLRAV
jgi:hypothetical protein